MPLFNKDKRGCIQKNKQIDIYYEVGPMNKSSSRQNFYLKITVFGAFHF